MSLPARADGCNKINRSFTGAPDQPKAFLGNSTFSLDS
jgi:hypothetical protein